MSENKIAHIVCVLVNLWAKCERRKYQQAKPEEEHEHTRPQAILEFIHRQKWHKDLSEKNQKYKHRANQEILLEIIKRITYVEIIMLGVM